MLFDDRSLNSIRNMIFCSNQRFGLLWGLAYRLSLVNVCLRWVAGILQNSSRNECENLLVMKDIMKIVILLGYSSVFFFFSNGTILVMNVLRLFQRTIVYQTQIITCYVGNINLPLLVLSSKVGWQDATAPVRVLVGTLLEKISMGKENRILRSYGRLLTKFSSVFSKSVSMVTCFFISRVL